ncbi:hypothetical protein HAX54_026580 [Datura stramonium]|uniref:Uncharacterized protein n=1 Tax=Datura stramonium TaxID=4076 RepID=A0ABS8V3B0_DATST|nr:hypothetical protein [Datura stramonium]
MVGILYRAPGGACPLGHDKLRDEALIGAILIGEALGGKVLEDEAESRDSLTDRALKGSLLINLSCCHSSLSNLVAKVVKLFVVRWTIPLNAFVMNMVRMEPVGARAGAAVDELAP